VRGTYADFAREYQAPQSIEEYIEDPSITHKDGTPMSVCSRYIRWLYPKQEQLDRQTLHDRREFIELHRMGNVLYFFRSQGSIPQWAKPAEVIHEKVMTFLAPQDRALYEGTTSKGVRMLAAEGSALCKEIKFVIDPDDEDQKRQIQHVLESMVNAHPKAPCPQGVGLVVFEFRPDDVQYLKHRIFSHDAVRSFADVLNFVDALSNATKNVRLQSRLNYIDMTAIAMSFGADWEGGRLFVDELYVTLKDWRRRRDYRDPDNEYLQSVSAKLLVFSTAGSEFLNPEEHDEFMSNLHFLSTNVREETL
jgi:hypothetical protein